MNPIISSTLIAAALLAGPALKAASLTFDATGTFSDGATLGGTIHIDTGSGTVTSSDLVITGNASLSPITFDTVAFGGLQEGAGGENVWNDIELGASAAPGWGIDLIVLLGPATSLVGYTGGDLCAMSTDGSTFTCPVTEFFSRYSSNIENAFTGGPYAFLTSGSLSEPAASPEPASACLLLAGSAALVFWRRRSSSAPRRVA